jgi:small subunit ribosomal protein S1
VTNITDYGAFIELEPGVEGLVHVSEMSWTKKNIHPGKIVSTSQEVEVAVLDVDKEKRRISLGLKQCLSNPWESFLEQFPVGSVVEGEVKNITEFGLFIGLAGDIDGMAHLSDLSWTESNEEAANNYKKGDVVRAKILDVDVEKERISLGIKQLVDDPFQAGISGFSKGKIVTCKVIAVHDNAIEVSVGDGIPGQIRKVDLSRDRAEQRPDRFAPGEKVDAKITQIDHGSRRLTLSIKARELEEEKKAVATYGSSDAGASLGDILGAAIREKRESAEKAEAEQTTDEDTLDEDIADDAADAAANAPEIEAKEPDEKAEAEIETEAEDDGTVEASPAEQPSEASAESDEEPSEADAEDAAKKEKKEKKE